MAGIKELSATLRSLQKQIPFATAQALTSVARKIQDAERTALQRRLENPTPFTVNAVGSVGARRNNLTARVFVKDLAASYLEPFEFGGQHKLNSQALLNPKNIKLNKYGNLTRNKMAQLKAKPDVFIGEIDGVNGVWKRPKAKASKRKKRRRRSGNGSPRAPVRRKAPKLLIRFGNALPVKPVLGYMARAEVMSANLMQSELSQAIGAALASAR